MSELSPAAVANYMRLRKRLARIDNLHTAWFVKRALFEIVAWLWERNR